MHQNTACMQAKWLLWCLSLSDPMDHSPPGVSVHGILQARILEWVAMPSSKGSSWRRDWTHVSSVSCIGRWVLYHQCHLEGGIFVRNFFIHSAHITEYILFFKIKQRTRQRSFMVSRNLNYFGEPELVLTQLIALGSLSFICSRCYWHQT